MSIQYLLGEKDKKLQSEHSQAVLQQWLLAEEPICKELKWSELKNAQWFSAARKVLLGWQATIETVVLQNQFEKGDILDWLSDSIFQKLYDVDPIFMGIFLKRWFERYPDHQKHLIKLLINQFYLPDLLQNSANMMKVDSTFLEHLIKCACALQNMTGASSKDCPRFESNLATALTVDSFRRLLAIRILETIKGK